MPAALTRKSRRKNVTSEDGDIPVLFSSMINDLQNNECLKLRRWSASVFEMLSK
jgi:hypothetical protein